MATTSIVNRQYRDNSISASKISATLDQFNAPVASLNLNSQKIINLATPTSSSDAATKGYVDTAVTGLLDYKGVIDCSTNPNYPAASVGDFYVVSVAGKIGGASGVSVEAGDSIICNTDNAGGTQASVGANFNIIQGNLNGAVIGPASATDTAVALFDGTTGKIIKNSSVTVDSSGNIITNGSLGSTGSRVVKGWFTDLQVTNTINGSITGNAATVTTNANLTGDVTSVGNATTIANDAVTTVKILDANVTAAKLASDSVTTVKILNANVTTAKIADANVTLAKIANASANSKLLGSGASGSGSSYAEITLGTGLSMSGTTLNASATGSFATGETPSGTINGTNDTFTLANTPTSGSVALYANGIRLKSGSGNDYTISGSTITFESGAIPVLGDVLQADYRY